MHAPDNKFAASRSLDVWHGWMNDFACTVFDWYVYMFWRAQMYDVCALLVVVYRLAVSIYFEGTIEWMYAHVRSWFIFSRLFCTISSWCRVRLRSFCWIKRDYLFFREEGVLCCVLFGNILRYNLPGSSIEYYSWQDKLIQYNNKSRHFNYYISGPEGT